MKSILVICTRQIGDVLLTTPLIHAAKQRWPEARIDVLGFAGTLGMLAGNPDVGQTIEVQPGSGWLRSASLIRRLWRSYDLALVTQRSDRAHLYAWVAARVRSGLVPGDLSLGWWKRRLLDHTVIVNGEDTHVVSEKFHLLDPWVEQRPDRVFITPPATVPLPDDLAAQLRSPMVVVHVPSMWRYKQWPLTSYRGLIAGLLAEGVQVVLTGGRSEVDRAQVTSMLDLGAAPALLDVCGSLTLAQVGRLLRQASLYIGPDTSVTHLAAACGVPVITLFGPTNPQLWGPWPQGASEAQPFEIRTATRTQRVGRVILLQGSNDCVPCSQAGCERHQNSRSDCLEGISAERVLREARAVLGEAQAGPRC